MTGTRGVLLPVYVVIDESAAMSPCRPQLAAGLARLCDRLRAEPMSSAKLRLTVLGAADDVRVRLALCDPRTVTRPPEPVVRAAADHAAVFADLRQRIPYDVQALKADGHQVQRPVVYMLTCGPPADPIAWQAPHQQLTDRAATPAAPNIIAFGAGAARDQTVAAIATHPRFALIAAPGTDTGTAVTDFFHATGSSLLDSARALGSDAAALAVDEPGHFRTAGSGAPATTAGGHPPAHPAGWHPPVNAAGGHSPGHPVAGHPPGHPVAGHPPGHPAAGHSPGSPAAWLTALRQRLSAGPGPGGLPRPSRIVAGAVVLALIAGVVAWLNWPKAADRTPFDQALASLARAEGVHYTDTSLTRQKRDITTTRFGEQFGVTGHSGNQKDDQGILRVGGKLYTKFLRETGRLGRWKTGDPGEEYMYGDLTKQFPRPEELASELSSALADLSDLPSPDDPGPTVGGVPALRADTSAGTLYVARHAPYRVLRLEPQGVLSPSRSRSPIAPAALPGLPSSVLPSSAPPSPVLPLSAAEPADRDSRGMDLSPIGTAEAGRMYDTLERNTRELSDAVDAGINFSLTSAGTFNCNAGGCNVRESFTGTLSTNARTRITGGQITAKLTVTNVTIDGRPAGGCVSAPVTLPVTGNTVSGELSCDDPEAGPVFAAVDQQYQQQAQQQANANGGRVTLTFFTRADAEVDAVAIAQAEVDRLLDVQRRERATADCKAPNSFAPGTHVLLADGAARPIEQITPGTLVRTTDPYTGHTTTEPVLRLITGGGPKRLDRLSITDGRRTATLTATANHPFWDPAQRAWVTAGDLRPGQSLSGPPGTGPAHVISNRAYQRRLTVYNLTVAGTHTYYVEAGTTPVLVHNSGPSCGVPLGFESVARYENFVGALKKGLEGAGYGGTKAAFQGSSVTGVGFRTRRPFGSHSDYDIALGGAGVFNRAKDLGVGLRSKGTRTGPLSPEQLAELGLTRVQEQLQEMAGREVHFMIYNDIEGAVARSPSIQVP